MKYSKCRDIHGTLGRDEMWKRKEGRGQGWLLVFWFEWEVVPILKLRVWVKGQISG